jgi:hypothetical protein
VGTPRWLYFASIVIVGFIVLFIAAHLMGSRFGAH